MTNQACSTPANAGQLTHTPGPWAYHHREGTSAEGNPFVAYEIRPAGHTYGWKDGRYLCVSGIIDEGDAALIAAAPELLEALVKLCAIQEVGDVASWAYEWDEARAAIAKATK